MTRPRLLVAVLLAMALAGAAFLLGTRVGRDDPFEPVVETAREIRERAAEPVSQEQLVRGAVRGMLEILDDPYAAFLAPDQAADAEQLMSGSYVGIGVWVEAAEGGARVASVLEGSPARDAGIVPGDLIVRIDGRGVAGSPTPEAAALLAGPEGSEVTLTLSSDSGERDVTLTRRRISLTDVRSRMIEGGVAYVRPVRLAAGAAAEVRTQLRGLATQGARGVVLDLRGNPGGLTSEAVDLAGVFLGEQLVARVREGGEEEELRATAPVAIGLPLAVLVDGGTASAAEMVAGALQDHGRATLVGTQTFGKGSLLAVSDVEGAGGSIRYTTGAFSTPDGHPVEGVGLVPDVPVLPGGPIDAQLERAVRVLLGEAP